MAGEGQFREQAKKQWEKLDAEGCKIINDLLVADTDRTVCGPNSFSLSLASARSAGDCTLFK